MSEYTIVWTSPANVQVNLSGQSYYRVLEDDAGWFMPGTNLILDYYATHAVISRARFEPRIITLPIRVDTSTQAEMDTAIEALCKAFNPVSGLEGTLRVTRHDGVIREIKAIYWNGLEGARSRDKYFQTWYITSVSLKCPNNEWYDPTPITDEFAEGSPSNFFPIFPLQVAAGAVFGDVTISNPGSVNSWPVWEIDGPGTNPLVENMTTGKKTSLIMSILTGETLVIDTRPGIKTIKVGSVNKFQYTTVSSSLWPLVPGDQTIKVTMNDTGPTSEVRVSFNPRYLTL